MVYLILAIVSSALVSLTMRASEKKVKNNISMLAANYLMCLLLGGLYTGEAGLFPAAEGLNAALLLGAISGVFYLASFMLLQWNIRVNGVVLPATFMKLGVLVPTLLAVVVFHETPRVTQVIGFALAIAAIVLIRAEKGRGKAKNAWGLLVLLVMGGLTDALSKIYEVYGAAALNGQYLFYTFVAAFVLCVALAAVKKQTITWTEAGLGLLLGLPNYFSARFLLLSLSSVPAVAAFPTYSVATIVLVTLSGMVFFAERLSRRQMLALGVILCALVLLNC